MTLSDDPHRVIVAVSVLKAEEEKPAEGALVEAEKAEPEVIGRGKTDEDGEEGEED